MFSTLMTIVRGETARTRERIENQNAVVILEQKIREAETSHDRAKRALARLILKARNEDRQINALSARQDDLESRIKQALKAELDDLANEAAGHLARMENEQNVRNQARRRTQLSIERLRHMIDHGQGRIVELKQGMISVKAIAAERASLSDIKGDLSGMAALMEGEKVLERFLDQPDPFEEMEIFDDINADLTGDALIDRLAAEGCGEGQTCDAAAILTRLRSAMAQEGE